MIVLLFIAILAVLILVHELGHFLMAKKMGMRVDEFGIGFPPKLFGIKKGETEYTINLIPLGGFVKIFGEDPTETSENPQDERRSMINKPKWSQALVISAGVAFNLLFAWILISIGFMVGMPVSVDDFDINKIENPEIVVVEIVEDSPAFESGLVVGDKILELSVGEESIVDFDEIEMQQFIASHEGQGIEFSYQRGKESLKITIIPEKGIWDDPNLSDMQTEPAVGIATNVIGNIKLNPFLAIWEGLKLTLSLILTVVVGLALFFYDLFRGAGGFSQITGPVGIVGLVGDAAQFGFIYLLNFTAFISINLAVINFIPFPALDGGRIVFIAIESVIRRDIKPEIANILNLVGFVLLIGLMIAVTYNDILKLF